MLQKKDPKIEKAKGHRPKPGQQPGNRRALVMAGLLGVILLAVIYLTVLRPKPETGATSGKAAAREATKRPRRTRGVADSARQTGMRQSTRDARRQARRERLASRSERTRRPRRERTERERPAARDRAEPRSSRASGRRAVAGEQQVVAISEGRAIIGQRTVREGDVIQGRVIRQITSDRVLVEYAGSTYRLGVGDALP